MSSFTGVGYPRGAAGRWHGSISAAKRTGKPFKIGLWTGASHHPRAGWSTGPGGRHRYAPALYQSDPTCRKQINAGQMQYVDIHLSHVAQFVWFGFLGKLDVAVVEVAGGCCPTGA